MSAAARRELEKEAAPAEKQPDAAAAPTALAAGMTPAGLLQLQRTAGNQAVQRMVLQRMTFVDTLPQILESSSWTEAKKKTRAKEIAEENKASGEADYEQASQEVDSAIKSRDSIAGGKLISVDDWVVMKKGLTTEEYRLVLKDFNDFKGDATEKETFLKNLPQDRLHLFTGAVAEKPTLPGAGPLEKQVEGTANAEKAQTARTELVALQGKDAKSEARLTDPIIALLVWGVAERRTAGDLGAEGIIGIEQAVDAAEALNAMEMAAYVDTVLKLDVVGGATWSEKRVESVLILKAVAARKSRYLADEAAARKEVGGFAGDIRGEDPEKLAKLTSTRDIGGGEGLQQKFTMSCGPTSIQIVRGESDPVYALDISKTAKKTLDYDNKVGKEQETLLGKAAAPRQLEPRWKAFTAALNGVSAGPADMPKWQAFLAWLGGNPADPANLTAGTALAIGLGFTQAELDAFKKYLTGLQTEPGLGVAEFQQRIQAAKLAGVTNDTYPLKQFAKGAVKESDIDDMWKQLFRGRDILMGVLWNGGGGHYMVLSDAKGDSKVGAFLRSILLSNPWDGTSEWLTGKQLADGTFGAAGSGWIDDIYY